MGVAPSATSKRDGCASFPRPARGGHAVQLAPIPFRIPDFGSVATALDWRSSLHETCTLEAMNFPHIVALLDEYLERLQRARDILSTLQPMPAPTRKRSLSRPKQANISLMIDDRARIAEALTAPASTPRQVAVRPARRIRQIEKRPRSITPDTAPLGPFGPSSHTGPVFVRAELLTSRSPSGQPATVGMGQESAITGGLTAEALAKRWLSTSSVH